MSWSLPSKTVPMDVNQYDDSDVHGARWSIDSYFWDEFCQLCSILLITKLT